MPVTIVCPSCGARLKADERFSGRTLHCPRCATPVTVTGVTASPGQSQPDETQPLDVLPVPTEPTAVCPFCGEEVKAVAKKCKHCGETIDLVLRTAEEARRAAERRGDYGPVFMNAGGGSSASSSAAAAASAGAKKHGALEGCLGCVVLVIGGVLITGWLAHSCSGVRENRDIVVPAPKPQGAKAPIAPNAPRPGQPKTPRPPAETPDQTAKRKAEEEEAARHAAQKAKAEREREDAERKEREARQAAAVKAIELEGQEREAEPRLKLAKQLAKDAETAKVNEGDQAARRLRDKAREHLRFVIERYPGTEAAAEAKRVLTTLGKG